MEDDGKLVNAEVEDASTWAECAKFVEGEEPLREDGFCEGKAEDDFLEGSVLVEVLSAPEVRGSEGGDEKGIQTLINEGMWTSEECYEVLTRGLGNLPTATRSIMGRKGGAVVCGLYSFGGFHGISKASEQSPLVIRYLNQFLREQAPGHVWTSLYVSHNTQAPLHRDLRNASEFPVVVRAVGSFKGGGLWVEDENDKGPVCKILPSGEVRAGKVHDIGQQCLCFFGNRWHSAEDWTGLSRWVIAGFVPIGYERTTPEQWKSLTELGFIVEHMSSGSPGPKESSANVARLEETKGPLAEWEVEVPCWIVEDVGLDAWLRWQEGELCLRKFLTEELSNEELSRELLVLGAENLWQTERQREWLESVLSQCRLGSDLWGAVRALQVEVPLSGEQPRVDQFLQTRTIGLAEARRELTCWKEPALEEVTSLEDVNEAVVRVSTGQVDKWIDQGVNVIQLPGKCVLTRKSGTGRRRCRAVCCGNYLPADKLGLSREDLYASGAEGVTLRIALAFAARYATWRGITIDVKSAFLYAPIGAEVKGRDERIIVKPPAFLTELGILKASDRWWVKKALYGLPTSPRDWGNYRDQEFRNFELKVGDQVYVFFQSKSDESLWFLRGAGETGLGTTTGLLVVYVDDLAFFAEEHLCRAFIDTVQEKWKASPPTWFGKDPITFCGVEIVLSSRGYRLTQLSYLRELLQRFQVDAKSSVPMKKWVEPEIVGEPALGDVREAQAITGALLWISTRSRPDVAFAVSKMGQWATKVPKVTIGLGLQVLAYLHSTMDLGLEFLHDLGAYFSNHGNLNLPRTDQTIEIYSDASHSPGGERSTQCVVILWRGSPIVWESCRQSFTTLSSAESELVSMVHSIQLSESVQPLIDELLCEDSTLSLMGDNAAAVRSFEAAGSGWRNRHLRMRAAAGRARILAGLLRVAHLPGEYQVADLGTKPLSRARILQLLELINTRGFIDASETVKAARMSSRLSLTGIASVPVTAKALAGLALLAALPGAQAQPGIGPVGPGSDIYRWVVWVTLCLVLGFEWESGLLYHWGLENWESDLPHHWNQENRGSC